MEPVKFKVGDKVKCLMPYFDRLELGALYVISDVDGRGERGRVWVDGDAGAWYPQRFEMVSEAQPNQPPPSALVLPTAPSERKEYPMTEGLLDYFPAALAEVSRVSKKGNDQHNPGQPMHHARGKSMDHPNCIVRHLVDRGGFDTDGLRHSAKLAWRALALLQEELEAAGAPLARGARLP